MLLNLSVCDKSGTQRGTARLRLDFAMRKWFLDAEAQPGWQSVTASRGGSFEVRPNRVIWIWDKDKAARDKRNSVILWTPPESEGDTRYLSGEGRLSDPRDPSCKDGKVNWSVATAAKSGLAPIRERFLEIIKGIPFQFAPAYKVNFPNGRPSTKPESAKGNVTNCGELPGWVAAKVGGSGAPGDLDFNFDDVYGHYALTSSMTGWEKWSTKLQAKRGAKEGDLWVAFSKGKDKTLRPKPGDIYVLHGTTEVNLKQADGTYKLEKIYGFAHVGIIIEATSDTWVTADCGQGEGDGRGFSGCYQKRAYSNGTLTLQAPNAQPGKRLSDAGTKDLRGWVNIESLFGGWKP